MIKRYINLAKYPGFKTSYVKGCLSAAAIEENRFDTTQESYPVYQWTLFFNGGGIETCEVKFTDESACQFALDKRIQLEIGITALREKEVKNSLRSSNLQQRSNN